MRDFRDINDLQQSRADRQSAFGTASTDVYMPVGNVPTMPEPEPADEPAARPGTSLLSRLDPHDFESRCG